MINMGRDGGAVVYRHKGRKPSCAAFECHHAGSRFAMVVLVGASEPVAIHLCSAHLKSLNGPNGIAVEGVDGLRTWARPTEVVA